MVRLELAKIVGIPSSTSWSGVHTFFPEDPEKMAKRGKLVAVVSLQSVEPGIESVALGREILGRLHEEYFGNLEGGVLERLNASLLKIKEEWPTTEVTVGVFLSAEEKNVFYLGVLGAGKVLIKRGGLLVELLAGEEEGRIKVGSGLAKEKDVFLIGNKSFFEVISEGTVRASLNLETPQEIVESLAPMVLGRKETAQIAAVVCSLFADTLDEIVPLSPLETIVEEEEAKLPAKESFFKRIKMFFFPLRQKIYFRAERQKTGGRKKTFFVALIFLLLFLGILVLGVNKKRNTEKELRFKQLFSQAEEKYNKAKGVIDSDIDLARLSLEEANNLLGEAEKIKIRKDEVIFLREKVKELLNRTQKDYNLGEIPVFFDLGLLKPQAKATAISRIGSQLIVLDNQNASLYFLDLEKKSSFFFSNENLKKAQLLASSSRLIYFLNEKGIFKVEIKEKKVSLIIPASESWGKIVSLAVFADNLYLLDGQNKKIWQYPKKEDGFGALREWLSPGVFLENEPVSLAIDGFLWILDKEGNISKFVKGKKDRFEIKGVPKKDLLKLKSFYLDGETQNLYLFDSENKKLVVLDKNGLFKSSYSWSGAPEGAEFIDVWEKGKKAILVKDGFVFSFDINESL